MKSKHLAGWAVLGGVLLILTADERIEARPAPAIPVQIGAMKSLFRDTPEGLIATLSRPLRGLMEAHTGMTGDIKLVPDAVTMATQLESQQVQLAVMHSFEYGWAREANPKLRALVIVSRMTRDSRFALVVRQDSKVKQPSDLKGSKLAIPFLSKEPAHLFLETRCCANTPPAQFFKEFTMPADTEEALDDVATKAVPAALVEKCYLDSYGKTKPKLAGNLKVLQMSEDFPTGVFVYREGHLPDEVLQRLRTGLVGASTNPKSKELLKLCKLTGFETPPVTYEAQIDEIVKAYPLRSER